MLFFHYSLFILTLFSFSLFINASCYTSSSIPIHSPSFHSTNTSIRFKFYYIHTSLFFKYRAARQISVKPRQIEYCRRDCSLSIDHIVPPEIRHGYEANTVVLVKILIEFYHVVSIGMHHQWVSPLQITKAAGVTLQCFLCLILPAGITCVYDFTIILSARSKTAVSDDFAIAATSSFPSCRKTAKFYQSNRSSNHSMMSVKWVEMVSSVPRFTSRTMMVPRVVDTTILHDA